MIKALSPIALMGLITLPAAAYQYEFIDCPNQSVSEANRAALKAKVESGIASFNSIFPSFDDFTIRAGYLCNEYTKSGFHLSPNAIRNDVIELHTFLPGTEAQYRKQLRQKLIETEWLPEDGRGYEKPINDYLDWKLSDSYVPELTFHELVHALITRSDLRKHFHKFISPSFDEVEKVDGSESQKIVESYRPELNRQLRALGLPEKDIASITISAESREFGLSKCWPSDESEVDKNSVLGRACEAIEHYNNDTSDSKQAIMAQSSRDIAKKFHLPSRHAFDEHVYDTMNPTQSTFDEEFLVISAEQALYPTKSSFYTSNANTHTRALHNFWIKTNFKHELKVYPAVKDYYLSSSHMADALADLQQRYPSRIGYDHNLNSSLNLPPTSQGRNLQLIRIKPTVPNAPKILIDAGHHSDELLAQKALIRLIDKLASDPKYGKLEFVIVPVVNPDGLQRVFTQYADQRCNARTEPLAGYSEPELTAWDTGHGGGTGVDINRNYPTEKRMNPEFCSNGPYPFSEIESRVIDKLSDRERPSMYLSLHDAGNRLECAPNSADPLTDASGWCSDLKRKLAGTGYDVVDAKVRGTSMEYLTRAKNIPSAVIEIGPSDYIDRNEKPHAPWPADAEAAITQFMKVFDKILF